MSDEQQAEDIIQEISEEDLATLIAGIDHSRIVDLVKHSSHLQQHVFRGFRPTRLPWEQVPGRLARYACDDRGRVDSLISRWVASNKDLLDEVEAISPDNIREGVVNLLARRGIENKLQVLWALRFDEREEVQQALEDGLAEEITAKVSELIFQAQCVQVAELQDNRRLIRHKNEQIVTLQSRVAELEGDRALLLDRIGEQTSAQEALEAELITLEQQLADEQATSVELRRSVQDLKSTLQVQAASSRQEETQQQLNETLLTLEEERRQTASLRLKLGKLEQQLENAYARRDEERERNDTLAQQVQKLERAKEVLIEEKRVLTQRFEQLQDESERIRRHVRDQALHETLDTVPLPGLEEVWTKEREAVRDYIHALTDSLQPGRDTPLTPVNKWELWSQWLAYEASMVQAILNALSNEVDSGLDDIKRAQQLLALRWYLLEYTRQAILSAAQEPEFEV
jgi:hypothetical protein